MSFVLWSGFIILILLLLFLDLGVFNKREHVIKTKEALLWTAFWVFLALVFNIFIYYAYENHIFGIGLEVGHSMGGKEAALKYFTGYVIEKSLSLDNIFVIAIIFSYFAVPQIYQHRVLFWGILGALIMRGIMIAMGVALIERFEWMTYVFGLLLLATAVKMIFSRHEAIHPDKNPLVKLVRRFYPIAADYHGKNFFILENGKRIATPLFLVLLVIESTDVIFAVDSIPAIFAVTTDPFIVFTSNVFAILGLRALYFALAAMMNKFKYLKTSLVFILFYVGIKMMLVHYYPISTSISLGVIILLLSAGVAASLINGKKKTN